VAGVEFPIEKAYGDEPDGRLHGCPTCSVTWFGVDARCWVCGQEVEGPVAAVPPAGSHSWSADRCADTVDDEETAAFLRRMLAATEGPPGSGAAAGSGGIGGIGGIGGVGGVGEMVLPVLGC